jgi:hypothetical protein
VDAAVGRQHPGVADQHVELAEPVHRPGDHGVDLGGVAHVRHQGLDLAPGLGQPAHGLLERRPADVAEHDVGVGLAGELAGQRGAERSSRAQDGDDTASISHAGRYLSPMLYRSVQYLVHTGTSTPRTHTERA